MAIDPIWIWTGLGALALIVVVALFARGSRRSRTESLREKFGSEYDHAVSDAGNRKQAERDLGARPRMPDRNGDGRPDGQRRGGLGRRPGALYPAARCCRERRTTASPGAFRVGGPY